MDMMDILFAQQINNNNNNNGGNTFEITQIPNKNLSVSTTPMSINNITIQGGSTE